MRKPSGELINSEWLEALGGFEKLFVGFSGGLDSTVLLHCLVSYPQLKQKLVAVHIHHGLSSNATFWQRHCRKTCEFLSVPSLDFPINLPNKNNLEESARLARYEVFKNLIGERDALVLGHHCDDQAETVLLNLVRGAGVDGLAAMPPIKAFAKGKLLRPLLTHSRLKLKNYALQFNLSWVEDESNFNCDYSRNFIRHNVLPLLKDKWPSVVATLARSAGHFQEARDNLERFTKLSGFATGEKTLEISPLLNVNEVQIKNVLRVWMKENQVRLPSSSVFSRLIHEVIFAREDAEPKISWENNVIRRYQNQLYLLKNSSSNTHSIIWEDLSKPLLFGNCTLIAQQSNSGLLLPKGGDVEVRSRQGGERIFWHGQHKSLKKLFQQWKIPTWQRQEIPLLYINEELAAVGDYAINDRFFSADANEQIYQIKICREEE